MRNIHVLHRLVGKKIAACPVPGFYGPGEEIWIECAGDDELITLWGHMGQTGTVFRAEMAGETIMNATHKEHGETTVSLSTARGLIRITPTRFRVLFDPPRGRLEMQCPQDDFLSWVNALCLPAPRQSFARPLVGRRRPPRRFRALFVALCLLASVLFAIPAYAEDMTAVVVSVYDGDTITVDIPGVPAVFGDDIGVRIMGIDTPEMRGGTSETRRLAVQARDAVRGWCQAGGAVTLRDVARDKYFRVLARVECQGVDVAAELVRMGLAKPYDGGTKEGW